MPRYLYLFLTIQYLQFIKMIPSTARYQTEFPPLQCGVALESELITLKLSKFRTRKFFSLLGKYDGQYIFYCLAASRFKQIVLVSPNGQVSLLYKTRSYLFQAHMVSSHLILILERNMDSSGNFLYKVTQINLNNGERTIIQDIIEGQEAKSAKILIYNQSQLFCLCRSILIEDSGPKGHRSIQTKLTYYRFPLLRNQNNLSVHSSKFDHKISENQKITFIEADTHSVVSILTIPAKIQPQSAETHTRIIKFFRPQNDLSEEIKIPMLKGLRIFQVWLKHQTIYLEIGHGNKNKSYFAVNRRNKILPMKREYFRMQYPQIYMRDQSILCKLRDLETPMLSYNSQIFPIYEPYAQFISEYDKWNKKIYLHKLRLTDLYFQKHICLTYLLLQMCELLDDDLVDSVLNMIC